MFQSFRSMVYHVVVLKHFGVPMGSHWYVDTDPEPRIAGSLFSCCYMLLLHSLIPWSRFVCIHPALLFHPHFFQFDSVILDVLRLWCYINYWLLYWLFNNHCFMTKIAGSCGHPPQIFEVFPSWMMFHCRVAVRSKVGEMAPDMAGLWRHQGASTWFKQPFLKGGPRE